MKSVLFFLLFFFCPGLLFATDNLRSIDIRSLGSGGNGVTQSAFSNPALISFTPYKSVHIEYFNRYAMKELGTAAAGYTCPNRLLPFAFDISSFGFDSYRESLIRISVGKKLNEKWHAGISIQYSRVQTLLTEEVPQQLSTDMGILFLPVDKLLIGVLIMNWPAVSLTQENIDIKGFTDYSFQIGFQWQVINTLFVMGTAESNKTDPLTGSFGIEYHPYSSFQLRAGIQMAPLLPAFGIGYCFSSFQVNAAFTYHPVLGLSTGIGFTYQF